MWSVTSSHEHKLCLKVFQKIVQENASIYEVTWVGDVGHYLTRSFVICKSPAVVMIVKSGDGHVAQVRKNRNPTQHIGWDTTWKTRKKMGHNFKRSLR